MSGAGILSLIILSGVFAYATLVVAYLAWTRILRPRAGTFALGAERAGRGLASLVALARDRMRKSRG